MAQFLSAIHKSYTDTEINALTAALNAVVGTERARAENAEYALSQAIANMLHPVRTIIINDNPYSSGISYGVWQIVLQGRVPVGLDSSSGIWTNSVGTQFGELTHTLTVDEIPSHKHGMPQGSTLGTTAPNPYTSGDDQTGNIIGGTPPDSSSTGGGLPHNNVQPSQVVVYWQRVS